MLYLILFTLVTLIGCNQNPNISSAELPAVQFVEEGQSEPYTALLAKGLPSFEIFTRGTRNDGGGNYGGGGGGSIISSTRLQFKAICGGARRTYAKDLSDPELRIYYQASLKSPVSTLYVQAMHKSDFKKGLYLDVPQNLLPYFSQFERPQANIRITFCEHSADNPQNILTGALPKGCVTANSYPSKIKSYCEYNDSTSSNDIFLVKQPAILVPFFSAITRPGQGMAVAGPNDCDAAITSPLVLDLNRDSKITTVPINQGFKFDLNGDGNQELTSWLSGLDGLLALPTVTSHVRSNGHTYQTESVTSGKELFGEATRLPNGELARDGFEAIAQYDSNHDGFIDAQDPIYPKLRIAKRQGTTLTLSPLSDYVTSLSIIPTEDMVTFDANGNELRQKSYFIPKGHPTKKGALIDIWFLNAPMETHVTYEFCSVVPHR